MNTAKKAEGVREQSAEEVIWNKEEASNRRPETGKNHITRNSL
jgi:hypothetical protein